MEGILTVVVTFFAKTIVVAGVMGILTRCGNILVRAFSGKEEFL